MPSVLVIGVDPQAIPGPKGQAVSEVFDAELDRFGEHGIEVTAALLGFDEPAESILVAALTAQAWTVVVIGGGIRKDEQLLSLFELAVNLTRRHAPLAAIAFNNGIADSVEAAQRWL